MARGINKVILVGHLGQDPDLRSTASGTAICLVNLATTRSWKNQETGERQDKTEWHRVVFFHRLAEIAAEYLRKGSQAYIEGRLQTRKWQDEANDGVTRYTTEIIASEMMMLGGRGEGASRYEGNSSRAASYGQDAPGRAASYGQDAPGRAEPARQTEKSGGLDDNLDGDIPF